MGAKQVKTLIRGVSIILLIFMITSTFSKSGRTVLAAPGDTTRVSVDSSGAQSNGWSRRSAISGDGRYVAFQSDASNLVAGDTNGSGDIFVHDRQTGSTTRVSVDSSGVEANGGSDAPAISSYGRYVAFSSYASNLVSGDSNGMNDVFVHDRQTGTTTRVSVDSAGVEGNDHASEYDVAISADGRYVAFQSDASNLVTGDTNGTGDVFVHDRQTGQTTRVSVASGGAEANGFSNYPNISGDGRYVVFVSSATNLVSGDTNGTWDVFVHDLQTGTTTLASVNSSGVQADGGGTSPDISGDGRYVVFRSKSNNIVPGTEDYQELIYVHDRQSGQTTLVSVYTGGEIMVTGEIDQPTISNFGRYVSFAFYDKGDNDGIMHIWAHDRQLGISVEVNHGDASSFAPSLSADGSLLAFWSQASNLVSGDTNGVPDVFVSEIAYGPDLDPSVVSTGPQCGDACPYPTPASVSFTVIFSEQVTGVTPDDFSLEASSGLSGAAVTGVSGSGSEYLVTADTGTGDGTLRLNVIDDDSILDSSLNPLGGAGAGNGDFTTGSLYAVDKSNPAVASILRADADPTSADSVNFTVNFNEVVTGVDSGDFNLVAGGGITGAGISGIAPDPSTPASTFTVTVNTGAGDGTLRLDAVDDDSILDWVNNPLGGAGSGNGDFSSGESYTVVKSVPNVTGSLPSDPSPTLSASVSFSVTFSKEVLGVDTSDFFPATTGAVTGANVTAVSGSGTTYTITVDTGSGDGTLRLDVLDDDSILDLDGIPLGGPGPDNGIYTSGDSYTIDKTLPIVTGSLRDDSSPTAADTVSFTVVFSEAVSGVDMSDFSLTTTGDISEAYLVDITGIGYAYSLTANTGRGDGSLRLDILDDDSITDSSGYPLGGAGLGNGNFTTGEAYTINKTPQRTFVTTFRSNGRNDGWVLESGETSAQGGSTNARADTLYLGDDALNRQFRTILHFPTFYLPDNAVVVRAILMFKGMGVIGSNPFDTHQNILIDVRNGPFGSLSPFRYRALQPSDFQAPASRDAVGSIQNSPLGNWYWTVLDSSANAYINPRGITQLRLRFELEDDNDLENDILVIYSGNFRRLPARPRLMIEYYRQR